MNDGFWFIKQNNVWVKTDKKLNWEDLNVGDEMLNVVNFSDYQELLFEYEDVKRRLESFDRTFKNKDRDHRNDVNALNKIIRETRKLKS